MAVEELRGVARHLAVAASQLARDERLPREASARFSAAEARFRELAADPGVLRPGPVEPGPAIRLGDGSMLTLGELLVGLCRRDRLRLENRSIDPSLVHAARELLTGLAWHLPGEQGE